ncbi:MAG: M12 family metallo-peptidase [Lewinella sp.]
MNNLISLLLALCCLSGALIAQTDVTLRPANLQVPNDIANSFHDYELVTLDVETMNDLKEDQLFFSLKTNTGPLDFALSRWDLRAANHQLMTSGLRSTGVSLDRQPSAQFRGKLANGGTAVFTIDPKFVIGSWEKNGATTNLEPLWRLWPAAPHNVYIIYQNADVKDMENACGTAAGLHDQIPNVGQNKQAGECFEVEIALAADFEMFQDFGDATSVENFMLGTLAAVQTNYDDEFPDALTFVVTATFIATTNAEDPWTNNTDPEVLLPDFRTWGRNGNFSASFDVASLWSGRDFDGSTVGLAYVGVVCTSSEYNVLQNFSTNAASLRVLWAHELGHNFGARHDPSGPNDPRLIMFPSVVATTEWSQTSIDVITNYYESVSCLASCPIPEPPAAQAQAPETLVCTGGLVQFFNTTEGRVNELLWSFPGGNPSSSNDEAPVTSYAAPGNYTATLTATNQFGSTSTSISVNVVDGNGGGSYILFVESFEKGIGSLSIINPDAGSNTWGTLEVEGNLGEISVGIDNYNNQNRGQRDILETPSMDLTELSDPVLEMEYAYNRYDAFNRDQLRILISVNEGTPQVLFTGDEDGSGNFATGPDNVEVFIPGSEADWCAAGPGCISLDLSPFAGESDVRFQIENVNGFGNVMWIDNFQVIGTCTEALPVEWLGFSANAAGKNAQLDWQVNQLEDNAGFTVERSTLTENNWEAIGWVPATHGPDQTVAYAFTDETIRAGATYYYRLRQLDLDGEQSFSEVRTVVFDALEKLTVWPNPTDNVLTIQAPEQTADYTLLNGLGQVLQSGRLSNGQATLNLHALPPAIYLLRVGKEKVRRIVRR